MENKLKQATEIIENLISTIGWLGWNSYEMEAISKDIEKAEDFLVSIWAKKSEKEIRQEEEKESQDRIEQSSKDKLKNLKDKRVFVDKLDKSRIHIGWSIHMALQHFWNRGYSQIERIDKNKEALQESLNYLLEKIDVKTKNSLFSVLNESKFKNSDLLEFYEKNKVNNSELKKAFILILNLDKSSILNLIK